MKQWFPWILWAGCALWIASSLRLPRDSGPFHIEEFGRLPVLAGGRIKPMDAVARTSLMILHGKQTLRAEKKTMAATEWLMDVLMSPERSETQRVFRIDHSDVLGLLGLQQAQEKYFSYQQIKPHLAEIERQAKLAMAVESAQQSLFQREILKLYHHIELDYRLKNSLQSEDSPNFLREIDFFEKTIPDGMQAVRNQEAGLKFDQKAFDLMLKFADRYRSLAQTASILVIPPQPSRPAAEWISVGQGLVEATAAGKVDPTLRRYAATIAAHRDSDAASFNRNVTELWEKFRAAFPKEASKSDFEFRFNHFQPFYKSMTLYVLGFVLVLFAWLGGSKSVNRAAFHLLLMAFVVHTAGLMARMYIQGRPPVTNLYSSAVFVGWGAVGLGLILERIYRDGIGAITAATLGFLTLLIAHHLSGDGDTMEMLRAVLDTNYWLATHVVVITLGYASTFLAGFLAIVYVVRGFARSLDENAAKSLEGMVYGIICFATLFSFVGTVLGGIWADQSWGRFWGWDPKENGALIIVLWNALILHARWGGLVRRRGLMAMAIFGNIVTSFSWFGVNMLGVGLHSYGFIDKAFLWLALFVVSQLALMIPAMFPRFSNPAGK